MNYKQLNLYVVAFLAGFSLMVFELAAARILAPSVGSSTYVWTSVIGVIIAALSLGYFVGGKLADRRKTIGDVRWISLLAAMLVVLMISSYGGVLEWSVEAFNDSRLQGLVASLLLFAPVSTLFGMLQPYLVKQNVSSLEITGRAVANLSALDAIGGIVGTFMAGFVLFGYLGSRETLLVVALVLMIISWLIMPRQRVGFRLLATATVLLFGIVPYQRQSHMVASIDTPTAHYEVIEGIHADTNKRVRGLVTGPSGIQSGVFTDRPDELVFWYTRQMAEAVDLAPNKERILMLGGGAFTLPEYLAGKHPGSQIDVVEIDPALEEVAREYFSYTSPKNVRLIFDDARSFLNSASSKYDVILVDVYGDSAVPFSLTTAEYGDQIAKLATDDTVVVANMIAGRDEACGELLEYYAAPYLRHFEYSSYWSEYRFKDRANIIAAFSHQPLPDYPDKISVGRRAPMTDNFAPIERLQQACIDYDNSRPLT